MKLERAKGTRDFGIEEQLFRNKITRTIQAVFEKYGFGPFETPIIERLDVMSAKFTAGKDTDITKEIFKLTDQGKRKLGLRYELTFPLARFIAMNTTIKIPYKRYQIGSVFRDGPIKAGRYREFKQCDIDTIGVKSKIADAENITAVYEALLRLGIEPIIYVNSRKLLFEILKKAKIPESKQLSATISIDKLDKIGERKVKAEMIAKGIKKESCDEVLQNVSITGKNKSKIDYFKKLLSESRGILELEELFGWLDQLGVEFNFKPSLARGLGYYTGPIFEIYANNETISSSIAAGGRWDNLIGNYLKNKKEFFATGASIGLEPIFEILKYKQKERIRTPTKLYIIPMNNLFECCKILQEFRKEGVNSEIDLVGRNLRKNLDYASVMKIPYVAIIGSNEMKKNKVMLKNMITGKQHTLSVKEAIVEISSKSKK